MFNRLRFAPIRLASERWIEYCRQVLGVLTAPHPSVIEVQERRRARFMISFVLFAWVINVILIIPLTMIQFYTQGTLIMAITATIGLGIYALSRSRFYRAAPTMIMVVALTFLLAMLNQYPSAHTAVLAMLPIFMSSLFYHARGILVMTALSLLVVIAAAASLPGDWAALQLTFVYLFGSTALTVVSNWLLRQSEANLQTRSEQLQDSQSRFRAAMDGSLQSFYIIKRSYDNADWSILEANRAAEKQAGVPLMQLISHKLVPSMLPAGCGDLLLRRCTEASVSKEMISDTVVTPDEHWYEYVIVPFNTFVALTITDITERKQIERQDLDLALERERVTLLQQIIGDASHDMMSPLSAVKMNVYLIKQAVDAEERAPRLAAVEQQITRLQAMIRDLSTMSELEQLSISKLDLIKLDANALLNEIGVAYDAVASVKQRKLVICPHGSPLHIFIDRPRFETAITNLIENAFKYTPEGSLITVSVEPRGVGVAFDVRDNGKGIDEEALPHLFERYYRAEEHRDANSGIPGTGLGLTIVKKIAEAHQGSIEAFNAPDGGAVFRLWLPRVPELESIVTPANPVAAKAE